MNCSQCGKKIEEGSKFCEFCSCKVTINEEKDISTDKNNNKTEDNLQNKMIKKANENYKNNIKNKAKVDKEPIENKPSIEEKTTIENNIITESDEENEVLPKKSPMSLWKKIVIAIVCINIIALAGGVIYLRKSNLPNKVVDRFLLALSEGNYEELVEVAIAKDSSISINENNSKALFKIYKNNSEIKKQIKSELNKQLNAKDKSKNLQSDSIVSLIEENHILYKSYKIGIQDYSIKLSSNLENTKIEGFDTVIERDKAFEEIDLKVLLGQYEVIGTSIDDCGIEYKYNGVFEIVQDNSPVFVSFNFKSITIVEPKYPVSNIYINDKPYSNIKFENGELEILPIPYGATVKIECKSPSGSLLVDTYEVDSEYDSRIYRFIPKFDLDEETKDVVINLASAFCKNVFAYFNARDIDSLNKLNYKDNIKMISGYISTLKDYEAEKNTENYNLNFNLLKLEANRDLNIWGLDSLDEFNVYIATEMELVQTYHDKDGKIDNDKTKKDQYDITYVVTVKNIDGNWVVIDMKPTI